MIKKITYCCFKSTVDGEHVSVHTNGLYLLHGLACFDDIGVLAHCHYNYFYFYFFARQIPLGQHSFKVTLLICLYLYVA